jgi:hypothetical protein
VDERGTRKIARTEELEIAPPSSCVLLRALEDAPSVGDEEHEAAMLIAALDLGSFVERRLLAGEN